MALKPRAAWPFPRTRTRILALSMHKDSVYVREMLRAGARGFLLKDSGDADLVAAVRAVAKGEGYLSPAVSDAVLTDYRRHVTDPLDLLTTREREVLQMIAEGKTNKEIATVLALSVYTVEAHRGRIMEKLNLHSTGELVRFALRNGPDRLRRSRLKRLRRDRHLNEKGKSLCRSRQAWPI